MVIEPRTAPVPGDASPIIEMLIDGAHVQLSLIGPGDKRDLLTGMAGLSKQSRYLRFFSYMPTLPKSILDGLLNTDAHNHVAIGARLIGDDNLVRPSIVSIRDASRSSSLRLQSEGKPASRIV